MTDFWNALPTPYIIAEIGVNHNGEIDLAKQMVDAAIACGVQAVKFQSFSADTVACRETLSAPHVDQALGFEGTFYTLLEKLSLTHAAQQEIAQYCAQKQIPFISTPFSFQDVDFLVSLNVPYLKIGSTDVNHPSFLRYAAQTGKPILLSTGMASLEEIHRAVETIRQTGNPQIALLHCVSLYPPEPEELNLKAIPTLKQAFPDLAIGFSDHSIGAWASTAAVALGATILEKHFTLDKAMAGPDQAVSADPQEMQQIVQATQAVFRAVGSDGKTPCERELSMKPSFRRSIVSKRSLPQGSVLRLEDLDFKRPGTGLSPTEIETVLGQVAQVDIPADQPIQASMIGRS